jgi:hypothetical protein
MVPVGSTVTVYVGVAVEVADGEAGTVEVCDAVLLAICVFVGETTGVRVLAGVTVGTLVLVAVAVAVCFRVFVEVGVFILFFVVVEVGAFVAVKVGATVPFADMD